MDNDPLTAILSTRRIPHGRSRGGRASAGSTSAIFDPLQAVGMYDARVGRGAATLSESSFTIHGLTEGEEGLVASFEIWGVGGGLEREGRGEARVAGMGVLAGSRTGLAEILEGLERDDEEEEGGGEVVGRSTGSGSPSRQRRARDPSNDSDDGNEEDEEDEGNVDGPPLSLRDTKLTRRSHAYAKNSFRNPKFWMRWRAHVSFPSSVSSSSSPSSAQPPPTTTGVRDPNTAYLVFSSNDCSAFEATISCGDLGWDNLRIRGRKVKSRVGRCGLEWGGFV